MNKIQRKNIIILHFDVLKFDASKKKRKSLNFAILQKVFHFDQNGLIGF